MLNNLGIGARLRIGFAVILLLLIATSTVSYLRLSALNSSIDGLMQDKFPKTVQTNDIINSANAMVRGMLNATLVHGEANVKKELDRIPDEARKIDDILDNLSKSIHSDEGKASFKRLTDSRAAFVPMQDKLIELVKAGKHDEAVDLLLGDLRKAQNEYLASIMSFIAHQAGSMQKAAKDANEMSASAELLVLALSVLAVLLTLGLAIHITRSITRPVSEAVVNADKIAEGDFSVKIDTSARGEVGPMLSALAKAVTAAKTKSAEASRLAQAALDGKLSIRADTGQHKGDIPLKIAVARKEHSTGVVQINGAMGQLNKVTQQNASASEQLAATAEQMGGQTGQLQELMSFFHVGDAGGGSGGMAKRQVSTAAATSVRAPKARKGDVGNTSASAAGNNDFERF